MENIIKILEKYITQEMVQLVVSNPVKNGDVFKIKMRPIIQKEKLFFQASIFIGAQVIHKNYEKNEAVEVIAKALD